MLARGNTATSHYSQTYNSKGFIATTEKKCKDYRQVYLGEECSEKQIHFSFLRLKHAIFPSQKTKK